MTTFKNGEILSFYVHTKALDIGYKKDEQASSSLANSLTYFALF